MTTVTIVTPSALSLARAAELEAQIAALQSQRKDETLGLLARAILDTPGLNSIAVYGYTPGFNDGDPCYHSQSGAYLNGYDYGGAAITLFSEEAEDDEEVTGGSGLPERPMEWGYKIDNAPFSRVSALVDDLSDGLESLFGTDWAICLWRLEDGTVGLKQISYDCGH